MNNAVSSDIATIGRISAVPAILQVICQSTGMRFAAVARVTEHSWTACAVLDGLGFGLDVGGELDVATTLCDVIRSSHQAIVIDKASEDPLYCNHSTPIQYKFESYISVPVYLQDGSFFGTICALDPEPFALKNSAIQPMIEGFAKLLSVQMEHEEHAQRTELALQQERSLAEVREQFIAVLGHDLRTPLFAITASAELLIRRLSEPRQQALARHILTSGQRANNLVRDVLDFARGRLGSGIALAQRPCHDLAEILRHVASELQRVHPKRQLQLQLGEIDGLYCDPERIAQLLSNLIANALVHGDPHCVVTVGANIHDGHFLLSVHNLGEPIPAQTLAQLFQPFTRTPSTTHQQGLGLGLYIAKQIALAHGGHMQVASSLAGGTVFSFHLPVDRPETAVQALLSEQ